MRHLWMFTLGSSAWIAGWLLSSISQAAMPPLDQSFASLEFRPIQERLRTGIEGLSARERFAAAQLLLSAASPRNHELGNTLLSQISSRDVPCLEYYRAESYIRQDRFTDALQAIQRFVKTQPKACSSSGDLFTCCPASKYRNASGLLKLAHYRAQTPHPEHFLLKLQLLPGGVKKAIPLVKWGDHAFLLDSGSEQHIWNKHCKKLNLKSDSTAAYGGQESTSARVVGAFAVPQRPPFELESGRWSGFALDLSAVEKSYSDILEGMGFCGIISPQQIAPRGSLTFDWKNNQLRLCQGNCQRDTSKKACAMYQFQGRPYLEASLKHGEKGSERLFLLDTGANGTSANLNYFSTPPKLRTLEGKQGKVVGVAGARSQTQVLNSAQFFFCGMGVSFQPFPVRPNSKGWEWSENGKIGFDLVKEAISSMDFGRGIVFLK